jgi:dTDP-glucose 4,6-dehydratase
MSKTLLLIGGTGFFGKSILKYFYCHRNSLKKKFTKIIILSRGRIKVNFYKDLKKSFKIIKINSNIMYIKKLPYADYVIYAAILKKYKNDYKAVKRYLDLAKKYHSKSKILYVSSGAIYGIQPKSIIGFKENYFKFNKKIQFNKSYKKEYSSIKLKNENLFKKFADRGRKVSIARCFSFVGEYLPQDSYYVVGNFIKSILYNKSIDIEANYQVLRTYMHEDDLVRWLLKILNYSNQDCPIYNVGSDDAISIHKLASILAKKYNLNKDFINARMTKKLFDKYIPNIHKARKELNLINNYSSVDAIIKTINLLIKNNEKIN